MLYKIINVNWKWAKMFSNVDFLMRLSDKNY